MGDVKKETVSAERLREIEQRYRKAATIGELVDNVVIPPVYADEIAAMATELLALRQPDTSEGGGEHEMTWRNLALQFDAHRIEALSLLRALDKVATSPDLSRLSAEIRAFLAAPPLGGEAVLAARIAALADAPPLNKSPTPEHVEGDVSVGEMDLETVAWNCDMWPDGLSQEIDNAMEVSDRLDMSTEQVLAYGILTSIQRAERERDEARHDNSDLLAAADADAFIISNLAAQLEEARKVLERGREVAPDVMRALLAIGGRDDILLADRVHKSDDAARAFLASLREKQDADEGAAS